MSLVLNVQGKQNAESDILLELEKPVRIDLIALIELEYQLSDLLGVKADLAIKDNLKPRIEKHVIREVVSVWSLNYGYDEVDIDIVWKAITETIPLYKPIFQKIAEDHK